MAYIVCGEFNSTQQKGGSGMTDTEKLNEAIRKAGIKLDAILKATGIKSYATLKGRINNETEFTASEIKAIEELCRMTPAQRDEIFFATNVE
jgi:hypothetical protein